MGFQDQTASEMLQSFVERVERLECEKASLAADIREVLAEAVGCGFDRKAVRDVIRQRRQEPGAVEGQVLTDAYLACLAKADEAA